MQRPSVSYSICRPYQTLFNSISPSLRWARPCSPRVRPTMKRTGLEGDDQQRNYIMLPHHPQSSPDYRLASNFSTSCENIYIHAAALGITQSAAASCNIARLLATKFSAWRSPRSILRFGLRRLSLVSKIAMAVFKKRSMLRRPKLSSENKICAYCHCARAFVSLHRLKVALKNVEVLLMKHTVDRLAMLPGPKQHWQCQSLEF